MSAKSVHNRPPPPRLGASRGNRARRAQAAKNAVAPLATGYPLPPAPDYLGERGKECYAKVAADLKAAGTLDRMDFRGIEAFACAFEEYHLARTICLNTGFCYPSFTLEGELVMKKRPEVEVMHGAWQRCRSLLDELYCTPASRRKAGTSQPPDEDHDPMAALLDLN
jgi:P27 family predicted phage terminase small subunit